MFGGAGEGDEGATESGAGKKQRTVIQKIFDELPVPRGEDGIKLDAMKAHGRGYSSMTCSFPSVRQALCNFRFFRDVLGVFHWAG
jgi:hypothetical protein